MKKKGLIISTVVMVIVLIASLGTATYAWFSSQATAAVGEMTINSTASEGITISAYDGTKWYNGDLTTSAVDGTPAAWVGSNEGQGSELNFDTNALAFYGASGNGMDMLTAGRKSGSTEGTKATNLYKATENFDYFASVIALQNTQASENAADVVAKISFKANGPMAAAARIGVFAYNGTGDPTAADLTDATKWDEKFVLAPFGKAVKQGATWNNTGATANTYLKVKEGATQDETTKAYANNSTNIETGTFTNLIVDENGYAIQETAFENATANGTSIGQMKDQGDLLYIRLVIWFEGEDDQCEPSNAGTGITVSITFEKKGTETTG